MLILSVGHGVMDSDDDGAVPDPTPEDLEEASMTATLLLGAPGTGKTTRLIDEALEHVRSGADAGSVLLLAPNRLAADRLRNDFSARIAATVSTPPARAWHSYAFDLLRRAHAEGLLPGLEFSPRLLAGPEQDVLIGEMLAAHAEGHGTPPGWPDDLHEALGTRGFRREIREFLDRCAEFGLEREKIIELGQGTGHPEWVAAARFRTEYEQMRRLRMPQAYDPSALIHEAADFLERHPEVVRAEHRRLRLILVDDLQEATPSIMRLLSALFPAGLEDPAELVITACPDTVVQGFRGARPQLLTDLAAHLPAFAADAAGQAGEHAPGLRTEHLETSHRLPPGLIQAYARIADRIPVVARARAERRPRPDPARVEALEAPEGTEEAGANGPELHLVASEQEELRLISQLVLEEHVLRGRELSRMAVIVREGSAVDRIRRHLEHDGVPVSLPVAETPVREEPAVRPFLDALWILTRMEDAHEAAARALALLTSRLGGASPNDLRRLRQTLRARELRSGGRRSGDELLVAALLHDGGLDAADHADSTEGSDGTAGSAGAVGEAVRPGGDSGNQVARGVAPEDQEAAPEVAPAEETPRGPGTQSLRRVAAVLREGARAMRAPGATAETVLWSLWEASGLAADWEREARGTGPAGDRANRDLDAMIEVFKAAERYVDQQPGAGAAEFLEYLDSQDLPMDTLAPVGTARDAVALLTPASAAGREWEWVCVASVQEGTWPNTTVRGSLLSTPQLADAVILGAEGAAALTHRARVQETRYDELRTFATAISRASEHLVVTAVEDVEQQPSDFLALLDPQQRAGLALTSVRRPMTLRGLIAELRQAAQDESAPQRAARAAACLARLARAGEPGAEPADWWGLLPLSEDAPALNPGEPVRLSPSRLETISRSPLDWFAVASGGQPGTDLSRSVGTLIHEIAQDLPDAPGHELRAELERRFTELGLPETWETEQLHQRALTMIQKFAQYAAELSGAGRSLVGVEGDFRVLVPGPAREALLAGRVDRLEVDELGRYVVIDLKTGRNAPRKDDVLEHPQLTAYQVALAAGAGEAMARQAQDAARQPQDARAGQESAEPSADAPASDSPAAAPVLELEGARLTTLSGGAALVQLGTTTKSYTEQKQPALAPEDQWAVALIQRCAELIAHHRFQARHDEAHGGGFGRGCVLPEICPLCAAGRQVTQP